VETGLNQLLTSIDAAIEDKYASDCGTCQQPAQFPIVADGNLNVLRDDTVILVVTGNVAG